MFIATVLCTQTVELEARVNEKVKYKTNFKNCPSQSAGKFAMRVLRNFEKNRSLYDVKKEINDNFLQDKHFIKKYEISFDPVDNEMKIEVDCPKPYLKITLMDQEAEGALESILVEDGDLLDPTYEILLTGEKKLKNSLPSLAINKSELNESNRLLLTRVIRELGDKNFGKIGEVIYDKDNTLTMILSLNKKPVSVFLGKDELVAKTEKLRRLLSYVEEKQKQPTVINLINSKKVVVKFAHRK